MGAIYVAASLVPFTAFLLVHANPRLAQRARYSNAPQASPLRLRIGFTLRAIGYGTPAICAIARQFLNVGNEWIWLVLFMVTVPLFLADFVDNRRL